MSDNATHYRANNLTLSRMYILDWTLFFADNGQFYWSHGEQPATYRAVGKATDFLDEDDLTQHFVPNDLAPFKTYIIKLP